MGGDAEGEAWRGDEEAASEAAGFVGETPEPFEAEGADAGRGLAAATGEEVESRAHAGGDAEGHLGSGGEVGQKGFLFGRAEADPEEAGRSVAQHGDG